MTILDAIMDARERARRPMGNYPEGVPSPQANPEMLAMLRETLRRRIEGGQMPLPREMMGQVLAMDDPDAQTRAARILAANQFYQQMPAAPRQKKRFLTEEELAESGRLGARRSE